jgi:hypothetical protein
MRDAGSRGKGPCVTQLISGGVELFSGNVVVCPHGDDPVLGVCCLPAGPIRPTDCRTPAFADGVSTGRPITDQAGRSGRTIGVMRFTERATPSLPVRTGSLSAGLVARRSSCVCRAAALPTGFGTVLRERAFDHGRRRNSASGYRLLQEKCRHFSPGQSVDTLLWSGDGPRVPCGPPGPHRTEVPATNECGPGKSARPFHDDGTTVTVCARWRRQGRVDSQRGSRKQCRFVITRDRMSRCRQGVKPLATPFTGAP